MDMKQTTIGDLMHRRGITPGVTLKPGLPPEGDKSQWIGIDKDGLVHVLVWYSDFNCWHAMGFEPTNFNIWRPIGILCRNEMSNFIVAHFPVVPNILTQNSKALQDMRERKHTKPTYPLRRDNVGGWFQE